MKKIKMLLVGACNPHIPGYCQGYAHAENYAWEYLAVAESNPQLLKNVQNILKDKPVQYFTDWRQMLDAFPDADAVQIGNDNKYHFEVFKEAIARHYHIYSTKVPTMNMDEGKRLLQMAQNYDKTIQVELELHFNKQFIHARNLVRSGKLGKIKSIYLTNVSQSPCNYFPNWGDPELSYGSTVPIRPGADYYRGGALTDHPHPFDLVRWITGLEFKTVYARSARNQRHHLAVEDHVAITGSLTGDVPFFINPSYSNLEEEVPKRRLLWPKSLECNLKLVGEKGYYAADYFDRPIFSVGKNCASPDRLIVNDYPHPNWDPSASLQGSFAACVNGLREKPESSLADGLAAVRVMNAAYDSIYQDTEISLEG